MNENVTKAKTVDDVIEHALNTGVIFSKKNIEFMREGVEANKVSVEYLLRQVDQISKRKEEIGLHWEDKEKPTEKGVISTYKDKTGKVHSYIVEREVKNSDDPQKIGTKFYVSNRIDPNKSEHVPMSTGSTIDGVKNAVNAYFTQIIMSEINQEKNVKRSAPDNNMGIDI